MANGVVLQIKITDRYDIGIDTLFLSIKKATDICSGLLMFVTILNQFKQTKAIAVVSSENGLSSVGQQFGIIEKSCVDNDLFKSASQ